MSPTQIVQKLWNYCNVLRDDLDEFVKYYNPENRHNRKPTWSEKKPDGRLRAFKIGTDTYLFDK